MRVASEYPRLSTAAESFIDDGLGGSRDSFQAPVSNGMYR